MPDRTTDPTRIVATDLANVTVLPGEQLHRITISRGDYAITHLVSCEPNRHECPVAVAAGEAISFPPPVLGTYKCALDDRGRLLIFAPGAEPAPDVEPGTLRHCSFLGCPASYDAATVAAGEASAAGWRQWRSLNLRLCPDHAPLWVLAEGEPGPHAPRINRFAVGCSCGWDHGNAGLTAGKLAEQYLLHLQEAARVDAAIAAFARAGTILHDADSLDAELAEIADKATGSHAIAKRNLVTTGNPDYPGAYAALCDLLGVLAAFRAAMGMEDTQTAVELNQGPQRGIGRHVFDLDAAMHSVWLHGDWRRLTEQMTTDQRDAAADAVERHSACLHPEDPATVDRWWREDADKGEPARG